MQYKIPQNVRIEDKIVGPLTLKQLAIVGVTIREGGFSVVNVCNDAKISYFFHAAGAYQV